MTARRLVALAFCWILGCGNCGEGAAPPVAEQAPLEKDKPVAPLPAPAEKPDADVIPERGRFPKPGWSSVGVDNQSPLCVFADFEEHYNAKSIEQAEKQKLPAKHSVVMGVFAGWCVNEACDGLPSMQCSVKREGNVLIVRSRYWGYRKDGSSCEGEGVPCRPVNAGCETPELEAGVYTVQHGERSFELRIPSVLRSPCFFTDVRTPPGE
jgi:hypothetical protein